jgi:hypothetical protein
MGLFPQFAVTLQRYIWIRLQLLHHPGLQGSQLLGRTAGDGFGSDMTQLLSLFEVAFDSR